MLSLKLAHEYSSKHRSLIEKSKQVGCFYCHRIYSPRKIREWTDDGQTAVCICGVDALLPSFWGLIDPVFLKLMNECWFGRGYSGKVVEEGECDL